MAKFTKKALREIATPTRHAADAVGQSYCGIGKINSNHIAALTNTVGDWTVTARVGKRSFIICNVPSPHHAVTIEYQIVNPVLGIKVGWWQGMNTAIDQAFYAIHRAGLKSL